VFIVTYVDLVNKRRTIGIERAIGISGRAITLNYLLKAVVFTFFGVLFGAALFFGGAIRWCVAILFSSHGPGDAQCLVE